LWTGLLELERQQQEQQ
jgi:hypothetical protein